MSVWPVKRPESNPIHREAPKIQCKGPMQRSQQVELQRDSSDREAHRMRWGVESLESKHCLEQDLNGVQAVLHLLPGELIEKERCRLNCYFRPVFILLFLFFTTK